MGFDAGHISGVPGFTLNEALKLIGNAVMPQQAAYAISLLLPLLIEDRKEA
jgi:DNA (cytosine-5)-methyltransferase 1